MEGTKSAAFGVSLTKQLDHIAARARTIAVAMCKPCVLWNCFSTHPVLLDVINCSIVNCGYFLAT